MPKLFGLDIKGLVAQNLGPGLLPVTVHQVTWGDRVASAPDEGLDLTETDITCKGVLTFFDAHDFPGTLVEENDRLVIVLVGTMSTEVEPLPGWAVTIEDVRYDIIRVRRDPAGATYSMQVRST